MSCDRFCIHVCSTSSFESMIWSHTVGTARQLLTLPLGTFADQRGASRECPYMPSSRPNSVQFEDAIVIKIHIVTNSKVCFDLKLSSVKCTFV